MKVKDHNSFVLCASYAVGWHSITKNLVPYSIYFTSFIALLKMNVTLFQIYLFFLNVIK
jgi:hypothetical protein